MDFNITGAKKLFLGRIDNQQEPENLDTELEGAIDDAKTKYSILVGYGEYNRVLNTPNSIPVTYVEDRYEYDNTYFNVPLYDMVLFGSNSSMVVEIGDGYFKTRVQDASITEVSLQSIYYHTNAFAWMLLYSLTFSARDLFKGSIFVSNTQWNDGNSQPAHDPINKERLTHMRNASLSVKSAISFIRIRSRTVINSF